MRTKIILYREFELKYATIDNVIGYVTYNYRDELAPVYSLLGLDLNLLDGVLIPITNNVKEALIALGYDVKPDERVGIFWVHDVWDMND